MVFKISGIFHSCIVDIGRLATTFGATSFYYQAKAFENWLNYFLISHHFLLTELFTS